MTNPLVSICIPTYNGEAYLKEALNCITQQTYGNLEVIISDDDSKDNTLKIVEQFKTNTNILVKIYNHEPQGIGANWNYCVEKANGEYIKFLFQDDVLVPNCIEKMVNGALQESKIGLVYSRRDFLFDINNKKNIEWVNTYKTLHESWDTIKIANNRVYKGTDLLKDNNLFEFPKNKIGEPTAVLLKKEVFNKVGYFSTTLKQALDIEYWYRVMKFYDVLFIDEALISFRLHNNQASNINAENYLNEEQLFNKSMYTNLFWQLSWRYKKQLFLSFSILGKGYVKLKKYLKSKK